MPLRLVQVPTNVVLGNAATIRMLLVQPYLELAGIPFQLTGRARARQIGMFRQLVSLIRRNEDDLKPNVTLFPEYAFPLDFIQEFESSLNTPEWPRNSIVISGLEGASAPATRQILESSNNPEGAGFTCSDEQFSNLCAIWVKDNEGRVYRYVQSKLSASAPEQVSQRLCRGDFVLLFSTDSFNFLSLICFDVIAETGHTPLVDGLLDAIGEGRSGANPLVVDFIFIPQHNRYPEYPRFLEFANHLIHPARPEIRTSQACVVFANSAASQHGRSRSGYGRSALYYSNGYWRIPATNGPTMLVPAVYALEGHRSNDLQITRARLREDGPSIHSFQCFRPALLAGNAGAQSVPLDQARCRIVDHTGTVGAEITPTVFKKVASDWFVEDFTALHLKCDSEDFQHEIDAAYTDLAGMMHGLEDERVAEICDILFTSSSEVRQNVNPDSWQQNPTAWFDDTHGGALVELIKSLVALGMAAGRPSLGSRSTLFTGSTGSIAITCIDGNNVYGTSRLLEDFQKMARHAPLVLSPRVLVLLSRVASGLPRTNLVQEMQDPLHISDEEMRALPHALQTREDTITEANTKYYWYLNQGLNEGFEAKSIAGARALWNERLGPCLQVLN